MNYYYNMIIGADTLLCTVPKNRFHGTGGVSRSRNRSRRIKN